jgi:hypothetical protein
MKGKGKKMGTAKKNILNEITLPEGVVLGALAAGGPPQPLAVRAQTAEQLVGPAVPKNRLKQGSRPTVI